MRKAFLYPLFIELLFLQLHVINIFRMQEPVLSFPQMDTRFAFPLLFLLIFLLAAIPFWMSYAKENFSLKEIIFWAILFSVTLVTTLPFGSVDVYLYADYGKIMQEYHLNPYFVAPSNYPEIPFFYYVRRAVWADQFMAYGPLWAGMSWLISFFSSSVIAGITWFRVFALLFHFATAFFIFAFTKNTRTTLLYAWNPFILFEVANNGHNDVVMIFFTLLSLWFARRVRAPLAFFFLGLAALIKIPALLFAPFLIQYFWKKKIAWWAYAVLPIVFALGYLPFWHGMETFRGIQEQSRIFIDGSLSPLPALLQSWGLEKSAVRFISYIFFSAGFLWWFRKPREDFVSLVRGYVGAVVLYLVFSGFYVFEWYLLWLVPAFLFIRGSWVLRLTLMGIFIAGLLSPVAAFFFLILWLSFRYAFLTALGKKENFLA